MATDPHPTPGRATPGPGTPDGAADEALPADDLPDDDPLDLAQVAALIAAQQDRVRAATDLDGRLLYGSWGVAWLIGFLMMWLAALEDPPVEVPRLAAGLTFFALLVGAAAITTVHLSRRNAGIRGAAAIQGEMTGWAWILSFAGVGALSYALGRLDASPAIMGTVMPVLSSLLVGVLYMTGAAVWIDRSGFRLGVWISSVTIVAAIVGHPHMLLVMALAGGGGLLAGAFVEGVQRRRAEAARARDAIPSVGS
ncbi:hypothetical protein J4G33_04660 [Actinotalea sp. BY-33]|uniref:Uncharacterized protein n=1 Tax=Actinotalea soli TaxID=2819234 RepID=A0A939RUA3_9CELL|nr:hypothetical protein [Actinotalea soli]MBO1751090.1 hypothetical protein [Actinotalea soli]